MDHGIVKCPSNEHFEIGTKVIGHPGTCFSNARNSDILLGSHRFSPTI